MVPDQDDTSGQLTDLLQLGASSELPALTIGGLALLESIESPFLDESPNGTVVITVLDTARALWCFVGGAKGCASLLSALTLERAAAAHEAYCVQSPTTAEVIMRSVTAPLRVKAAEMRAHWDTNAIQALEGCGKTKAEVDAELLTRIKEIIAELGTLRL